MLQLRSWHQRQCQQIQASCSSLLQHLLKRRKQLLLQCLGWLGWTWVAEHSRRCSHSTHKHKLCLLLCTRPASCQLAITLVLQPHQQGKVQLQHSSSSPLL